jgi:hypothetical protein
LFSIDVHVRIAVQDDFTADEIAQGKAMVALWDDPSKELNAVASEPSGVDLQKS